MGRHEVIGVTLEVSRRPSDRLETWFRSWRLRLFDHEEPARYAAVEELLRPHLERLAEQGIPEPAEPGKPQPCLWLNPAWSVAERFREFVPKGFTRALEQRFGLPVLTGSHQPYERLACDVQDAALATGFQPRDLLGHLLLGRPQQLRALRTVRLAGQPGTRPNLQESERLAEELARQVPAADLRWLQGDLKKRHATARKRQREARDAQLWARFVEECERTGLDPAKAHAKHVVEPIGREFGLAYHGALTVIRRVRGRL